MKQESFVSLPMDHLREGDVVHISYNGVLYLNRVVSCIEPPQLHDEEQIYPLFTTGGQAFLVERPAKYFPGDLLEVTSVFGETLKTPVVGLVTSTDEFGTWVAVAESTEEVESMLNGSALELDKDVEVRGFWNGN